MFANDKRKILSYTKHEYAMEIANVKKTSNPESSGYLFFLINVYNKCFYGDENIISSNENITIFIQLAVSFLDKKNIVMKKIFNEVKVENKPIIIDTVDFILNKTNSKVQYTLSNFINIYMKTDMHSKHAAELILYNIVTMDKSYIYSPSVSELFNLVLNKQTKTVFDETLLTGISLIHKIYEFKDYIFLILTNKQMYLKSTQDQKKYDSTILILSVLKNIFFVENAFNGEYKDNSLSDKQEKKLFERIDLFSKNNSTPEKGITFSIFNVLLKYLRYSIDEKQEKMIQIMYSLLLYLYDAVYLNEITYPEKYNTYSFANLLSLLKAYEAEFKKPSFLQEGSSHKYDKKRVDMCNMLIVILSCLENEDEENKDIIFEDLIYPDIDIIDSFISSANADFHAHTRHHDARESVPVVEIRDMHTLNLKTKFAWLDSIDKKYLIKKYSGILNSKIKHIIYSPDFNEDERRHNLSTIYSRMNKLNIFIDHINHDIDTDFNQFDSYVNQIEKETGHLIKMNMGPSIYNILCSAIMKINNIFEHHTNELHSSSETNLFHLFSSDKYYQITNLYNTFDEEHIDERSETFLRNKELSISQYDSYFNGVILKKYILFKCEIENENDLNINLLSDLLTSDKFEINSNGVFYEMGILFAKYLILNKIQINSISVSNFMNDMKDVPFGNYNTESIYSEPILHSTSHTSVVDNDGFRSFLVDLEKYLRSNKEPGDLDELKTVLNNIRDNMDSHERKKIFADGCIKIILNMKDKVNEQILDLIFDKIFRNT